MPAEPPPDRPSFPVRPCGPRGLQVTRLGLGGAAIEGAQTLESAYVLGLRHVDTSPAYGRSERRVGIALNRNDFVDLTISTKVGCNVPR